MKKLFVLLIIILCFSTASIVKASETIITYVSSEGVYINAGTNAGLQKGDTLQINRGNIVIATMIIENISTKSAACRIINQNEFPKVDDTVTKFSGEAISVNDSLKPKIQNPTTTKSKKLQFVNQVSGYVAFQQYYQKDFTSSSLSTYQPSLKTKLKVKNIGNTDLTFKFNMRSRYFHRSKQISITSDKSEWSHRLYEFAIFKDTPEFQWSVGRQSIYQAKGIGYIDGFYIAKQMNNNISLGGAFGSEPKYVDQTIDFNRKKAALFLTYEKGSYESTRYIATFAFAGSYVSSNVNREFFNISADFYSEKFSTNHVIEIDLYRSWRKEAVGKTFDFTSYYSRINYALSNKVNFHISYDNRHQVRYYEDVYIADTLFDLNGHQGLRFGTLIKFNKNTTFTSSTGIRLRSDGADDNKFINSSLNFSNFPYRRNFLALRFTYVKTMFTDASRPSISFKFPISKIYLTTTGSLNIYKTGTQTLTNTYLDLNSYYNFSQIYFMSASIRQYFDAELKSTQIFFELGKNF